MADPFAAMRIIAEQRICEAMEKGDFDNLPGRGKPLQLEDLSNVPEELRMAYKILKNAHCLPPELGQRKEIANLAELLENCKDEQQRLRAMRKLRLLLDRMQAGSARHMQLEQHDEYYQKILALLERQERRH